MANKRISELTAITGANLADADLLVVVDVSDTTMASSGTNKKITMSELAKDSALTDNLIAKTTLTTDGDVLTRAAGAPARITRADLAQDSAFSSRYMPLDKLWLPAGQFLALSGSPSTGTLGNATFSTDRQPVWLLDAAAVEIVGVSYLQPANWATFDIYVWWSNAGAGSGDVFWQYNWDSFADGESTDVSITAENAAITAPAQYIAKRSKLNTTARTAQAGEIAKVAISRVGSNAGDTLANDCGLIGVELVRVS